MDRASYYERDGKRWNVKDYDRAEHRTAERVFVDLHVKGQSEPVDSINIGPVSDKWEDEGKRIARELNKRMEGDEKKTAKPKPSVAGGEAGAVRPGQAGVQSEPAQRQGSQGETLKTASTTPTEGVSTNPKAQALKEPVPGK